MDWDSPYIENLITLALKEDVGFGDVSVAATVSPSASANAHIVVEQDLVCAGLPLIEKIFGRLDPDITAALRASEGQKVTQGTNLADLSGNAAGILTGEQTVLNFLARLCGIATLTREYVDRITGTGVKIRDTRHTTPGLRQLEQYAIQMGGGVNHHVGLFDAIVLTQAHIAAAGGIKAALDQAHSHASRLMTQLPLSAYEATGTVPEGIDAASLAIQIAICGENELREALSAGAESMLLSGLTPQQTEDLVRITRTIRPDCVIESAGGFTLAEVRHYAESGVDYLSPHALAFSPPGASLRLLVEGLQEK
jgi:nicotinate-nucleotide pyrophosphorylase (carboxylating)